MKLRVKQADRDEVFTDMVRIPQRHRPGIKNGSVIRLNHNGKQVFAIVRGLQEDNDFVIKIDAFVREKLGVNVDDEIDGTSIRGATCWEEFWWSTTATNPAVRVSAKIAALSLFLGILSFVLGLLSLCPSLLRDPGPGRVARPAATRVLAARPESPP